MKCKYCNYEWDPRTSNPKACPRCKVYLWQREKPGASQASNHISAPNHTPMEKPNGGTSNVSV